MKTITLEVREKSQLKFKRPKHYYLASQALYDVRWLYMVIGISSHSFTPNLEKERLCISNLALCT